MATRFAPQTGGAVSGTLFDQTSDFAGGVSGTMTATLTSGTMSATGDVTQFWVESFDITVNVAPTYVETFYAGSIGTFFPTLSDAIMESSESPAYYGTISATLDDAISSVSGAVGLPSFGTMSAILSPGTMNFVGSHIVPIAGVLSATLADSVLIAGYEFIGKKFTKVYFKETFKSTIWVR